MTMPESEAVAAEKVQQIVDSTPSFRAQERETKEAAKEAVAKTIQVMKEARDRIGDFFAVVGEGEREALILHRPTTRKVRWNDTREDILHTYVLFHKKTGIRGVNFVQQSTSDWYKVEGQIHLAEERNRELAFAEAVEGIARLGPEQETSPSHTLGYHEYIPPGDSEPDDRVLTIKAKSQIINIHSRKYQFAITDLTDAAVVEEALKASIAEVKSTHQKGIEVAKATTAATQVVNQELSVVKEPQGGSQPQKSGGIRGWFRGK